MITDARSAKLAESRRCELCWWFAKSSEQYRVSGELKYVGPDDPDQDLRKQQWGNLSDKAREQFYWVRGVWRVDLCAGQNAQVRLRPGARGPTGWGPR